MLLKSVTLNNFRQFQDAHIDFAQGIDGKNVTIIIGKNGSGKTSLAQAFFWCLYGETSFADKILLNRKVAENLSSNKSATVRVELELHHGVFDYLLRRKQIYKKNAYDQIRSESTRFEIQQKDQIGNTKWIDATSLEYEVKRILPRELARYFFFDGERIEKMGQDVSAGKKAEEFAEAVKRLLGLSGMLSAIDHLGGGSGIKRNSVIGKYESDFDATGDQKIRDFTATIERCDSELTKIEDQIKNLNEEIKSAENRKLEDVNERFNSKIDSEEILKLAARFPNKKKIPDRSQ